MNINTIKKILATVCFAVLVFSLVACSRADTVIPSDTDVGGGPTVTRPGGTAEELPNVDDNNNDKEPVLSGRFESEGDSNLKLLLDWEVDTTGDMARGAKEVLKIKVSLTCGELYIGARPGMGVLEVNGEKIIFSTEPITKSDKSMKTVELFAHTALLPSDLDTDVSIHASWQFNGVYGGEEIGELAVGGKVLKK